MYSNPIEFFTNHVIKKLQHQTALILTLRFALVFFICTSVLFFTADYLLSRSQLEKDQHRLVTDPVEAVAKGSERR